jgi:hypothetical protein
MGTWLNYTLGRRPVRSLWGLPKFGAVIGTTVNRLGQLGAEWRERSAGEWLGPGLVIGFLALVASKQLLVNASGGNRHGVAAVLLALTAVVTAACIAMLIWRRDQLGTLNLDFKCLALAQLLMIAWWSMLVLIAPGGTLNQRLVSFSYDAGYPLLVWVPVALLRSDSAIIAAQRAFAVAIVVASVIGLAQYLFGDPAMPGLLRADQTVALSGTPFGTVRVNGLVGTSIDFGMVMSIALVASFIRLQRRISLGAILLTVATIPSLLFSGSRASWLIGSAGVLAVTRRKTAGVLLLPAAVAGVMIVFVLPGGYVLKPILESTPVIGSGTHPGAQPGSSGGSLPSSQASPPPSNQSRNVYQISDARRETGIQAALRGLKAHPLLGTGIGFQNAPVSDQTASKKVITDGFAWAVLLEGGVPGGLLAFGALAALALLLFRGLKLDYVWALSGLVALAIALANSLINSTLDNQTTNIGFFLFAGLCLAALNVAAAPGLHGARQQRAGTALAETTDSGV